MLLYFLIQHRPPRIFKPATSQTTDNAGRFYKETPEHHYFRNFSVATMCIVSFAVSRVSLFELSNIKKL